MGWTMLYLFLFLKLPIVAAGWIVWWAVHQDGEEPQVRADGDGGQPTRPHPHRRPPLPRPPRRGPHAAAAPAAPPRVRSVTAAGRTRALER